MANSQKPHNFHNQIIQLATMYPVYFKYSQLETGKKRTDNKKNRKIAEKCIKCSCNNNTHFSGDLFFMLYFVNPQST